MTLDSTPCSTLEDAWIAFAAISRVQMGILGGECAVVRGAAGGCLVADWGRLRDTARDFWTSGDFQRRVSLARRDVNKLPSNAL